MINKNCSVSKMAKQRATKSLILFVVHKNYYDILNLSFINWFIDLGKRKKESKNGLYNLYYWYS